MKKIFITGATGFIGQALTRRLTKEGHEITALYRSRSKIPDLPARNLRWVKGDLLQTGSFRSALQDCDEIYHLAAHAAMWSPDPGIFEKLNVEATRNILEMARAAGVRRVLVTSTAGVIGPSHGEAVDENTKRQVEFFSEYERTKWRSEQFIRQWDGGDTEVVIVNPTRVFGPGLLSVSNGVTRMIDLYVRGRFRILPGGNRIGNYSYIEDVVEGHLLAMEKGVHRERYLLGGENIRYEDFFEILARVSGRQYWQLPIPSPVLQLAARFMRWRADRFGTPPLITPGWADRFTNYDWAVSVKKAERALGYRTTPLERALAETVGWLREGEGEVARGR